MRGFGKVFLKKSKPIKIVHLNRKMTRPIMQMLLKLSFILLTNFWLADIIFFSNEIKIVTIN